MELANQIKARRKNLGWSQEVLAEKAFVSRQTVSNWENEKSYPDVHSLLLLSELFQISLDELIKGACRGFWYVSSCSFRTADDITQIIRKPSREIRTVLVLNPVNYAIPAVMIAIL